MKILKSYRSKHGFHFNVIARKGDIALAQSGGSVGYEVFEVQSHNGREVAGRHYDAAEYPPSNEQWGSKGWSFQKEEPARAKFGELTACNPPQA